MHHFLRGVQMRDYRKELQDFIDGKKDDALTLQELYDLLDEADEALRRRG